MRINNFHRSPVTTIFRLTGTFFASIALASAAMAYTVVFRDGHRVEVPAAFNVSTTTLTYEAALGINRTVQLILIDVAATERANNEQPGSFFTHADRGVVTASPALNRHAQHTLTNRDLEPIRQRRIESEQNYEKRRIALGLPSIEETRRRQALEEEETLDLARRRAASEADDEAYWRRRAGALRNEIVTVDAEIGYVRTRLGPVRQVPFIAQGFVTGGIPAGPFEGRTALQPGGGRMGTMAAPAAGARGLTSSGVVALRSPGAPGFSRRGPSFGFPVLPFGYVDNSYDLNLRLNDLLQRRAGLDALWRALENDARIAKVPQVWLAP